MGTQAKEDSQTDLFPPHLSSVLLVGTSLPKAFEGAAITSVKTEKEALAKLEEKSFGLCIFSGCSESFKKNALKSQPALQLIALQAEGDIASLIRIGLDLLKLKYTNSSLSKHFQEELLISEKVQRLFLEEEIPQNLFGLLTASLFLRSEKIDSDFIDFFSHGNTLVDFVIGDVMGKGLPAALLSTAIKLELRRFASPPHEKIQYQKSLGWALNLLKPEEILEKVHQELIHPLKELEFFVSLFYGRFDLKNFTFTYIDCGSAKPLHFSAKTGVITSLKGENFPLGIAMSSSFFAKTISFAKEDLFLFYSDGAIKARSPKGELFGVKRLMKILLLESKKSPEEIKAAIEKELRAFTKGEPFEDEISLLVLKFDPAITKRLTPFPNCCTFSSDFSQLPLMRDFVHSFCAKLPCVAEKLSYLVQIAVNEVVTNIILHGYSNEKNHPIIIQGFIEEESVGFEILDQGKSFNPSTVEDPNFSGSIDHGFGLYIVKSIADTIHYMPKSSDDGFNSLKFTKQFLFNEVSMELVDSTRDGVLIITLNGDFLDAKEAPQFKKEATELFNQKGIYRVVLDLSKLSFIDSTGLGAFLSLLRTLNGLHGDLKLANMTRPIRTIFELVCMHKIFNVYDSVDKAVQAYKEESSKPTETKAK